MRKMFEAINHMHSMGVAHRDIKPQNVMLTTDNQIKLIDFGLSKRMGGKKRMKTYAGTPLYMAP